MRIGVVTYWSSDDNYGQQLQCFALQQYLISQGHDAFLIKYLPPKRMLTFFEKILKKVTLQNVANLITGERKKNRKFQANEMLLKKENEKKNKARHFSDFRRRYIRSTETIYGSISELRQNPPSADIYICGSDQVWNNPILDENTAGWFLDFGEAKRIAYAVSIGRNISKKE